MERAAALLELRRVATGAVHDGAQRRLILRLSQERWPARVKAGLVKLAKENKLEVDFKRFDLFSETRLLGRLLNEGAHLMKGYDSMESAMLQVETLEARLNETRRQLENEQDVQRELARTWWLQKQAWWFIAGALLLVAVALASVRLKP